MLDSDRELWEILVPTAQNSGKPFRTRHHREWDKQVYKITGGLTIYQPAKGKWVSPRGQLFQDRVIPVRVACLESDIEKILEITLKHYDQEAVMAYRVSERVLIKHRE